MIEVISDFWSGHLPIRINSIDVKITLNELFILSIEKPISINSVDVKITLNELFIIKLKSLNQFSLLY